MQDKPWRRNEELRRWEEALPRLKESELEKPSRTYKAKTGVGCDGFHPRVPLEKVEQSGKWPQQACATMFFLIPKSVTSERPIALMPTLMRWWEALRAAKWQQKYRVDWDATDGRNGGDHQTVWEIWMEMERFNGNVKEEDQQARDRRTAVSAHHKTHSSDAAIRKQRAFDRDVQSWAKFKRVGSRLARSRFEKNLHVCIVVSHVVNRARDACCPQSLT